MVVYSPQLQAAQINSYPAQGVGQACTTNLEHYNQYAQAQLNDVDHVYAGDRQLFKAPKSDASFTLTGSNNRPAVVITLDPPSVEVDPDLDWNTAAKCFWNAVCRMSGRTALFPDIG